jgi:hypothetical protein
MSELDQARAELEQHLETGDARTALERFEAAVRANERSGRAEGLREAAAFYEQVLKDMGDTTDCDPRYWLGIRDVALGLRRRADEPQP